MQKPSHAASGHDGYGAVGLTVFGGLAAALLVYITLTSPDSGWMSSQDAMRHYLNELRDDGLRRGRWAPNPLSRIAAATSFDQGCDPAGHCIVRATVPQEVLTAVSTNDNAAALALAGVIPLSGARADVKLHFQMGRTWLGGWSRGNVPRRFETFLGLITEQDRSRDSMAPHLGGSIQ